MSARLNSTDQLLRETCRRTTPKTPRAPPNSQTAEGMGTTDPTSPTASDALEEEERLFYVAITRAKSDLYLLTESGRESDYLSRLGIGSAST